MKSQECVLSAGKVYGQCVAMSGHVSVFGHREVEDIFWLSIIYVFGTEIVGGFCSDFSNVKIINTKKWIEKYR